MEIKQCVENLVNDIVAQNAEALKFYFHEDAIIQWICTNERFNVDEYIVANCEYPGAWNGEIERIEILKDLVICASHIYLQDYSASFHVVSFIQFKDDKIIKMDEYWGDDTEIPSWRQDKKIGVKIKDMDE